MVPDPSAISDARHDRIAGIGAALGPLLRRLYDSYDTGLVYSPDAGDAGKRALRHAALKFLSRAEGLGLARAQFDAATNMTDQVAALSCLIEGGDTEAVRAFEAQWQGDRLVMDKWFMLQVASAPHNTALSTAEALTRHPLFDWKNPNRFRSVIGALGMNPAAFHDPTGAGYDFVADWLIRLDQANPQTAARLSTMFETWRRYDADRQAMIGSALDRIAATDGLSRDMGEMVARIRGS
jgi:aminopeptidase N